MAWWLSTTSSAHPQVGAFGELISGFLIPRKILLAGRILVGVVVAVQIVTIAGIASSSTGFEVSSGGWITPAGFLAPRRAQYLDNKS
jgi:hypothetical protein